MRRSGNEDDLLASTVGEIAPSNEFYDYEAKYLSGTSGLYIPAHLESGVIETIRSTAQKAIRCWAAAAWHGWTSL